LSGDRILVSQLWLRIYQDEGRLDGEANFSEEELRDRKAAAVTAWMVSFSFSVGTSVSRSTWNQYANCPWQEAKVGADKIALAKLLRNHHVLVRGGVEEGQKLMDALMVRALVCKLSVKPLREQSRQNCAQLIIHFTTFTGVEKQAMMVARLHAQLANIIPLNTNPLPYAQDTP
jgi:hypothetical protein